MLNQKQFQKSEVHNQRKTHLHLVFLDLFPRHIGGILLDFQTTKKGQNWSQALPKYVPRKNTSEPSSSPRRSNCESRLFMLFTDSSHCSMILDTQISISRGSQHEDGDLPQSTKEYNQCVWDCRRSTACCAREDSWHSRMQRKQIVKVINFSNHLDAHSRRHGILATPTECLLNTQPIKL